MHSHQAQHKSDTSESSIEARERQLISSAQAKGYVTFEEVQALYPPDDESGAADALLLRLLDLGVNPVAAASVQPTVTAVKVTKRRSAKAPKSKRSTLSDLDKQYLAEIQQFRVLSREQEQWIGIAMECPGLTVDGSRLRGTVGIEVTRSWDALNSLFMELLALALRQGRYVAMRLAEGHEFSSTLDASNELSRLIRTVQARREGTDTRRTSVLTQLLKLCPSDCIDNLYDLAVYLWALPTSALQFLQQHTFSARVSSSVNSVVGYHCDECGQLDEQLMNVRCWAEQAERRLIRHNLRLVTKIAYPFQNSGLPLVDLCQEGNVGLVKAAERFDFRRGNRFSTYATWWIRQTIMRAVADQCRTIRLPVHMHEIVYKIHRAEEDLKEELGRRPSLAAVAEACELTPKQVRMALQKEPKMTSLDALICCPDFPLQWDSESGCYTRVVPCPLREKAVNALLSGSAEPDDDFECPTCVLEEAGLENPSARSGTADYSMLSLHRLQRCQPGIETTMQSELRQEIAKILGELRPRQQHIIERRYGLKGGYEHTLNELGVQFGVTRERIRQIESQVIRELRNRLRYGKLRGYLDR